ncbi:hypothetical protein FA13DRAFT_1567614, partial [Coprinellus micaceus]
LSATWTSPVYAFFHPRPIHKSGKINGKPREWQEFTCGATNCTSRGPLGRIVRRFTDTKDAKATGNLKGHAEGCWGTEIVAKAIKADLDVGSTRESLKAAKLKDGSLDAVFKRMDGKAPVTFSHRQHTYKETRVECVRWVVESLRSTRIVDDAGFHRLMKTGRPHYKIPKSKTVSRDVHRVFARVRARVGTMLKNYDGHLSFSTDAWTSRNNRAFVAVAVHFENNGEPVCMLLDIVEVA